MTANISRGSIFGYDTRSLRSAMVMRAIDALIPLKKERPFAWAEPCIVSSIAGLGDLFIHMPLVSGIVNACRDRGLQAAVALRPAHVEIGHRCGWETVPFDSGIEAFFKNPRSFRSSQIASSRRVVRAIAPALWIDLTGNAINALAIKICGGIRLAARITRGGKSLVDHPLPHVIHENEYANRDRVASFLGCNVDADLHHRIVIRPRTEFADVVLLCVTTASRWKNWPLRNFRALVKTFRGTRFVLVGFSSEVLPDEQRELERLASEANVSDWMDRLSTAELVDVIAHCRAVISNDTSAAHIANFFGKSGAVLFGPVSPRTFGAPDGLRIFHDGTCPFHPCVQWHCKNQGNWCMRKIAVRDVAAHLAAVLGCSEPGGLLSKTARHPAYGPNRQWQTQVPV